VTQFHPTYDTTHTLLQQNNNMNICVDMTDDRITGLHISYNAFYGQGCQRHSSTPEYLTPKILE